MRTGQLGGLAGNSIPYPVTAGSVHRNRLRHDTTFRVSYRCTPGNRHDTSASQLTTESRKRTDQSGQDTEAERGAAPSPWSPMRKCPAVRRLLVLRKHRQRHTVSNTTQRGVARQITPRPVRNAGRLKILCRRKVPDGQKPQRFLRMVPVAICAGE